MNSHESNNYSHEQLPGPEHPDEQVADSNNIALGGLAKTARLETPTEQDNSSREKKKEEWLSKVRELYSNSTHEFYGRGVGEHHLDVTPEEYVERLVQKEDFLTKRGQFRYDFRYTNMSPLSSHANARSSWFKSILSSEIDDYLNDYPDRKEWFETYAPKEYYPYTGEVDRAKALLLEPLLRLDAYSSKDNLADFLVKRHALLGTDLPPITTTEKVILDHPVETLRTEFEKLYSETREPELAKLNPEERTAVCRIVLDKLYAYHRMIDGYGERERTNRRLFDPVEEVIAFYENKEAKMQEFQQKTKEQSHKARYEALIEDLNQGLNDTSKVNENILNTEPLTVTYVDGENAPLKKDDISSLIHDHLRLVANQKARQALENGAPANALWSVWNKPKILSIGDKLIGKFHGTVRNLRFVALPVEQEYYDKFIDNHDEVDINNCIRFAVAIDLKSSGKPEISNVMDVVMYVRNLPERGPAIGLSVRGRSKNEGLVEFLHLNAVANARKLEIEALKRPFSAGLPSLGKH